MLAPTEQQQPRLRLKMVLSRNLSRSLRAREDDSDSEPYSDELEASSPSVLATGDGGEIESSESGSDEDEAMDDAEVRS